MKRAFYTIGGTIIADSSGGVRTDYMHDALGSVIGTVDSTGTVTNTYRWKPYGSLLSSTGPNATPTFAWLGALGYRATGRSHADYYVRARSYSASEGIWLSPDSLWPQEAMYVYSASTPMSLFDFSGSGAVGNLPMGPRGGGWRSLKDDAGGGAGHSCSSGQVNCNAYIYQIPGAIMEAIKEKLNSCFHGAPKDMLKCIGEVFKLKELRGEAGKVLWDHLWKYLRCYYSSTLTGAEPGCDPCTAPIEAFSCCDGHLKLCQIQCFLPGGKGTLAGAEEVLASIGGEHQACLLNCEKVLQVRCMRNATTLDEFQTRDPWPGGDKET